MVKNTITYHIDDSRTPTRLKVTLGNKVLMERKFGTYGAAMGYLLQNTSNVVTAKAVTELRKLKPFLKNSNFSFTPKD